MSRRSRNSGSNNGNNLRKGEKIVIRRDSKGRVTEIEKKNSSCWVVTATFGEGSRELHRVSARCRRTFVQSPFLLPGWCLYKIYGRSLAHWANMSVLGSRICKRYIATPIVLSTGTMSLRTFLARLYLVALSILGAIFLLPFCLLKMGRKLFQPAAGL